MTKALLNKRRGARVWSTLPLFCYLLLERDLVRAALGMEIYVGSKLAITKVASGLQSTMVSGTLKKLGVDEPHPHMISENYYEWCLEAQCGHGCVWR